MLAVSALGRKIDKTRTRAAHNQVLLHREGAPGRDDFFEAHSDGVAGASMARVFG